MINLSPMITSSVPQIAEKLSSIPQFYFPRGTPVRSAEKLFSRLRIEKVFKSYPNQSIKPNDFHVICREMRLPIYAKRGVYEAVCKCSELDATKNPEISFQNFEVYWKA